MPHSAPTFKENEQMKSDKNIEPAKKRTEIANYSADVAYDESQFRFGERAL
jgi:hypothetical protein